MDFVITVGVLALVLVIAFGVLATIRQVQDRTAGGRTELRQLDSHALGTRERLVLMRWRGEILLLGVTAQSINLLHREAATVEEHDEVHSTAGPLEMAQGLAVLAAKSFRRQRHAPKC